MPSLTAPLTAASKRRLSRLFRIPGDVRLGDILDSLMTQVFPARVIGQASNLSVTNHVVWTAPYACTITGIDVTFDVNDVGAATTASHTFTAKRNNTGTAIASLVSTATINKGVATTLGALDATTKVLAAGDTITLDIITGSTAAASQNGVLSIKHKVNAITQVGSAT